MRVEGGWVSVRTRSGAARAPFVSLLTNVPSRAAHTERDNGTLGRGERKHEGPTPRGDGDQFFLRRNLPTSRLAASFGFACA